MSHAEIARQSTKGSLVLFVGNLASTAILAAASIIVARLLGPDGYGLYTLAFLVPNVFQLFVGFGVTLALTRYSSYYRSVGDEKTARRMTKNGLIFLLLFGLALSFVNFLGAGFVADGLLHRPQLTPYVQLASVVILALSSFYAAHSAFIGWNSMGLASIASVMGSGLKLVLSLVLMVLLGLGIYGAIYAHLSAYLVSGGFASVTLYVLKLRGKDEAAEHFIRDVREMTRYGLPLYTGTVLSTLSWDYLTFLLAVVASNVVVGYYQVATNLTAAITLTSTSIASSLFSAFSSLDGIRGNLALAYRYAVKYVAFVMTPLVFFLASSSGLLIGIFYGDAYAPSIGYLQLLSLSYFPVALGLTVIPVFLNGVGKTRQSMYVLLVGAFSLFLGAPFLGLILRLGVVGLICSVFLFNVLSTLVGFRLTSKQFPGAMDLRSSMGMLGSSILSSLLAYTVSGLSLPPLVGFLLMLGVFAAFYLSFSPWVSVIEKSDLETLTVAFSGLGLVAAVLGPFLKYEGFMLGLRERVAKFGRHAES